MFKYCIVTGDINLDTWKRAKAKPNSPVKATTTGMNTRFMFSGIALKRPRWEIKLKYTSQRIPRRAYVGALKKVVQAARQKHVSSCWSEV